LTYTISKKDCREVCKVLNVSYSKAVQIKGENGGNE